MDTAEISDATANEAAKPIRDLDRWVGDPHFMQSLARGLLALAEVAGGQGRPVSAQEIARETGLSVPTVRRCIYTLNATGHVRANRNGAIPGPKLADLASAYVASSPLVSGCGPILDALHQELGVTISLSLFDGEAPTIIASSSTDSILRIDLPVGSSMPLHCSSAGKLYLASLDDARLAECLTRIDYKAWTPHTITDAASLSEEVQATRSRGFAMTEQELAIGLRSASVAVTDPRGKAVGSVNASLVIPMASKRALQTRIVPALQAAATRLSRFVF